MGTCMSELIWWFSSQCDHLPYGVYVLQHYRIHMDIGNSRNYLRSLLRIQIKEITNLGAVNVMY